MKNNLLKKFISFSIGGYIALTIGFLTTPIVTRMLSPEQYGISSMVTLAINMILLVCGLGLDQGFVRHFYEEDEENRGKLLYNSLKYPIILVTFASIIIFIFKNKVSIFLFGEIDINMIIIFIVGIYMTLINRFSILVIRMSQKAKTFSILQVLTQILNFIFIILLFKIYGNNYKTLVLGTIISLILTTVISIILERKFWKFNGKNSKITTKQLLEFSLPFTITMALSWIFSSVDKLAIKYFSTLLELGLYAAAFKIVSLLNIIQTGFTTFWTPVAYEKYEKDKEEKLFFENIHEYISFFMFAVAVLLLMGKDILILILGPEYKEASDIMPMLILMPIMYTISETTVMGINFKKKTKCHLYISLSVAILNIAGNLILVPKYGAKGAAISTGIVYILFFTLRTYFSLKYIKYNFNLRRFYMITFLITTFSLYLSFFNNKTILISGGILLFIIIFILYNRMLKRVFNEFIFEKKGEIL